MNNIIVQDVGAEKDAITSLRAPTHFGRPKWDRVFGSITEKHPETDVGVVCAFFFFFSTINRSHSELFMNSFIVALLLCPRLYTKCRTNGPIQRAPGSSSAKVRLNPV